MLVASSFIVGLLSDWWWLVMVGGSLGELAHRISSARYRSELDRSATARKAALISTAVISSICLAAFFLGRLTSRLF